ncbi:unnamed protein product [Rhizopus stolonifer]
MPKTPPLLLPTDWALDNNHNNNEVIYNDEEEDSSESNALNNESDFTFMKHGEDTNFIQHSQAQSVSSSAAIFQKNNTQKQQEDDQEENTWEETMQDLQTEFQLYMEEYSQIKKDLDMKKKALYLEIVERKEYLEQRGAEIYQKWDVLKEFI